MPRTVKLIPIYTSNGEAGAFLAYPYVFNPRGEWIGWVANDRQVYSVHGDPVGVLSLGSRKPLRILRARQGVPDRPQRRSPPPPPPVRPPEQVPQPARLPALPAHLIDVLSEAPELLPPHDFDEFHSERG